MRKPLQQSDDDGGFFRPHHAWQCGLIDEGHACPPGPLPGGRCPGASACRPLRQGDRWICNRSDLRGGPCEEGPQLDGVCPHAYHCQPRPTLRTRRGRFVLAVFALAVGCAAIGLSSNYRNDLLAPGPLSTAHTRLASRENNALRCGHCHAAGNRSFGQWLSHSLGEAPLEPAQAALCLKCHADQIPADAALHAHQFPEVEDYLAKAPGAARRRDPRVAIACAACHREHQGVGRDLTAVSNEACHACHAKPFESFAVGHSDFDDWPAPRNAGIAFDHRTHSSQHFPASKATFACVDCHQLDDQGVRQTTLGYQAACAACHDRSIAASLADGIPLLALPTIDLEALADAGVDAGPWPEQAVGDFDGPLPLWLRLLLAESDAIEPARLALGPTLDFYDVEFDDPEHLEAAGLVIAEIRGLLDALARDGYAAIGRRVERLTGVRAGPDLQRRLAGYLSAETIAAIRQGWLAGQSIESLPVAPSGTPDTAWRIDDATTTLAYIPTGHADPAIQAWLDVATAAASGPARDRVAPLLEEFLAPTAAGLCTSCHQAAEDQQGQWQIAWTASPPNPGRGDLTRFSHGPHLSQPQLADCTSCHVVQTTAAAETASEFAPLRRQDCAACHTQHGAGDRCTQCHRYHAHPQADR